MCDGPTAAADVQCEAASAAPQSTEANRIRPATPEAGQNAENRKKPDMKKTYGVANVSKKDIVESAAETGGGGSVAVPLIKIDGDNAKLIAGVFELPVAAECKEATIEVAYRILGMVVTKDLLGHLPASFTAEHIGSLFPFFPFAYHRRFGATYSDRVCPASTRTGRCPVCDGRMELFRSEQYKDGRVAKDDIIKNGGFGTRQVGLVVARVFFNNEDLGVRCFTTALTNEQSANAKFNNFFDLVENLTTPKKLLAGETLPLDYYSNGDGARWLVAEYTRAIYSDDDKKPAGDGQRKRPPRPYWQLSKITPTKTIEGVGKAQDIWWPEVGKKDGAEIADIYGLINHTPAEELEKIAKDKVQFLLNPRKGSGSPAPAGASGGTAAPVHYDDVPTPTWEQILGMDVEELVVVGSSHGGDGESLELTGASNVAALRRSVAKLCGVAMTPVRQPQSQQAAAADNESLPF